jgi:hypothetical protein
MTPEEIMKNFANTHSYESWDELMYDSHDFYQIQCTKEVMVEFAKQMAWEVWQEMDEYNFPQINSLNAFNRWWERKMSEMTKMTKNN